MATKKSVRKNAVKKTATRGRKAVAESPAVAAKGPGRGRGRGKGRGNHGLFGYITEKTIPSTEEGGEAKIEYGAFNGPFFTDTDALEDAAMVAGDDVDVLLFKVVKRGRVQRTTKIV